MSTNIFYLLRKLGLCSFMASTLFLNYIRSFRNDLFVPREINADPLSLFKLCLFLEEILVGPEFGTPAERICAFTKTMSLCLSLQSHPQPFVF